jgi:para-nitrobenzyl esterase
MNDIAIPRAADHVVETPRGLIRGSVSGGVLRFLGIPYAAPPVGDLRFEPPGRTRRSGSAMSPASMRHR